MSAKTLLPDVDMVAGRLPRGLDVSRERPGIVCDGDDIMAEGQGDKQRAREERI